MGQCLVDGRVLSLHHCHTLLVLCKLYFLFEPSLFRIRVLYRRTEALPRFVALVRADDAPSPINRVELLDAEDEMEVVGDDTQGARRDGDGYDAPAGRHGVDDFIDLSYVHVW